MTKINLINNCEAEQSVLACCLIGDKSFIFNALSQLKEKDFYRIAHQKIFQAMSDLYYQETDVNAITLAHILQAKGILEECGGRSYLLDLANFTFAYTVFDSHLKLVKQLSIQREITKTCAVIAKTSCSPQIDFERYVSEVQSSLQQLVDNLSSFSAQT